jgi:hypothetical protein
LIGCSQPLHFEDYPQSLDFRFHGRKCPLAAPLLAGSASSFRCQLRSASPQTEITQRRSRRGRTALHLILPFLITAVGLDRRQSGKKERHNEDKHPHPTFGFIEGGQFRLPIEDRKFA